MRDGGISSLCRAPEGFAAPNTHAPLDIVGVTEAVPPGATVKGLFNLAAIDALKARGVALPSAPRFAPFQDYPLGEHNALMIECARALHPDLPIRTALIELGALAFPAFASTLLGRMLYGVYRRRVGAIFALAARGFELSQQPGRVRTDDIAQNAVILSYEQTFTLLDTYQVGVMRGTLQECGVEGEVLVRDVREGGGEIFVTWVDAAP